MRFAAVQFDILWEDKAANHAIVERMLDDAQPVIEAGTFVLLPELGDTGFSMNLDRIVDDRSLEWAMKLAKGRQVFVQHGFARAEAREAARGANTQVKGRNCAVIVSPACEILADYEKFHPFSYGREAEHYSGGDHISVARCGEFSVCPLICYDLRFPELWRLAALDRTLSAGVFTIGASWPAARQHHWRALCIARAIENQTFVVAVNRCGRDPHVAYAGGSIIVSPKGEILAEAGEKPQILQADVDADSLRQWRDEFPALRDARRELLGQMPIAERAAQSPVTSDSPAT